LDADIPALALAITAALRGGAQPQVQSPKNERYVRIVCPVGPDVSVRSEDWARILPLLQDGTFNPLLVPVEAGFKEFDSVTRFSASLLKSRDPLYRRVLFYLSEIFPEKVPTSEV
jgi:hypothetical protein